MTCKLSYIILFVLLASGAEASIRDTFLSEVIIEKDLGFSGRNISVHGKKNPEEEVAVLVYGPLRSYNIIRKEKLYGMWLNSKHFYLPLMHSYYRIAASKSLSEITDEDTLKLLGFKLDDNDCIMRKSIPSQEIHELCNAFYKYKTNSELYDTNAITITTDHNNFTSTFNVPHTSSIGIYHITVFSFNKSGKLTDKTSIYFLVRNGRIFQTLNDFAANYPLTHSILAITFALMVGGLVGLLFNGKHSETNKKSGYPAQ